MKRAQVQWGNTTIPFTIQRSARRSTVSIAVDPKDGVVVTAPFAAEQHRLEALVRSKAKWIVSRLRTQAEPEKPPGREFVSGETFLYLGRQYRLRVITGTGVNQVALRHGWLESPGGNRANHRKTKDALVAWYRKRAGARLPGCAARWAKKLGVPVNGVRIASPPKRWGSCDVKGVLRFNWRIIQAPARLVDYVVAHEVVHLVHDHHGADFWATLGRLMPDYDERRLQLRTLGPRLEW